MLYLKRVPSVLYVGRRRMRCRMTSTVGDHSTERLSDGRAGILRSAVLTKIKRRQYKNARRSRFSFVSTITYNFIRSYANEILPFCQEPADDDYDNIFKYRPRKRYQSGALQPFYGHPAVITF